MHFSPLDQLEPGSLPRKHQLQPGDRPGLPAWGQGGDQLHRLTKSPSGLSHLACQPEEGGQVMVHKYKYKQAQIQIHRWMVTSYLPITHPTGLASSVLGLSFLALAEHFRGPERELWATCRLEPHCRHLNEHFQGNHAADQGGGDAGGAQLAPGQVAPPW